MKVKPSKFDLKKFEEVLLDSSPEDSQPLAMMTFGAFKSGLRTIFAAAIAQQEEHQSSLGDQIAYDEPTAARLVMLEPHQLRDERLRGRIAASQIVGKRIRYLRADLLAYLNKHRSDVRI